MHRSAARGATSGGNFQARDLRADPPIIGTPITYDILNAFQEELCNCIERMGTSLDDSNDAQLSEAIHQTWVTFKVTTSPDAVEILDSQNVDSVTILGAGQYEIAFTNDYQAGTYDALISFGTTGSTFNPDRFAFLSVFASDSIVAVVQDDAGNKVHDNNARISVRISGDLA